MSGIPSSESPSSDPKFRPFSWHNADVPPSYKKALAEHALDIGNGIATLLALIEFDESERLDDAPLLSAVDRGNLLRLAITASKLLAHFSYIDISRRNQIRQEVAASKES